MKLKLTVILATLLILAGITQADVTTTSTKAGPFSCNGSTTTFDFTFPIFATSDLVVIHRTTSTGVETVLTETTDYTVSATNNDYEAGPGGTVTTVATYASGVTITILADIPDTQATDLDDSGILRVEDLEDQLDKLTLLVQQLQEQLNRAVKIPRTESSTVEAAVSVDRAEGYLYWDSSGNLTTTTGATTTTATVSAFGATLLDDATAAAAQSTLLLDDGSAALDLSTLAVGNVTSSARILSGVAAFGNPDTSPSVSGGNIFTTDGTAQTLIDFDDGTTGQQIVVISTDATVFDVTGTNLTGGTVDITTADGDVTTWVCEDGTVWILTGFIDVSADLQWENSTGTLDVSSITTVTEIVSGRSYHNTDNFGAADTTPSVAAGNIFLTDGTAQTLTDFDDGLAGQVIAVISTDATVFDVTSTDLKGGTVDITTADGDVTYWVCEDGADWILISWVDVSRDYLLENGTETISVDDLTANGVFVQSDITFGAADTTPTVAEGNHFLTHNSSQTLTDFDDGVVGQEITVISTNDVTFAFSGDLTGSSESLVTADGDVTTWISEDGTTWILTGFIDASEDNSQGAEIVLLATVNINLGSATAQALYTVPTGFTCMLDHAKLVVGADAGASTLTIGQVGALTDFLPTQTITALNTANSMGILRPVPNATTVKHEAYAAATVLQVDVTAANGGAVNTLYLYGSLY